MSFFLEVAAINISEHIISFIKIPIYYIGRFLFQVTKNSPPYIPESWLVKITEYFLFSELHIREFDSLNIVPRKWPFPEVHTCRSKEKKPLFV